MENTSGLKPLGRAVLVKPYEPKTKSVIELPPSVQQQQILVDQRVVVVEVGPACWPDEPPRAKIGDHVLISKFSGYMARGTKDGAYYRIINDKDIFAGITEEE